MERRAVLAGTGGALLVPLAGCLGNTVNLGNDGEEGTGDDTNDHDSIIDRVKECEKQYIHTNVATQDNERIDGSLQPDIVDTESRDGGEFVTVGTGFGVTRDVDSGPDEILDYFVTASYLVSGEAMYRTEGLAADGDPLEGIQVDC